LPADSTRRMEMLINDCVKFSHRLEVIMFGRKFTA